MVHLILLPPAPIETGKEAPDPIVVDPVIYPPAPPPPLAAPPPPPIQTYSHDNGFDAPPFSAVGLAKSSQNL